MYTQKLERFAEIAEFPNVFHLTYENLRKEFPLKGKWNEQYFRNSNPIVLELGCGKGEYTVGLAGKFPQKNFIGVDVKGNRMWVGAKFALQEKISNVGFLRTRIDFIEACFAKDEVNEIWITFPDPQPQKPRERKRLTSPMFLDRYKKFLMPGGIIHLKTDSEMLYNYTLGVIENNNYRLLDSTNDLYNAPANEDHENARSIQTYYEQRFLRENMTICYLKFTF